MPATLVEFARVNDQVASTASKLEKQRILSDYFKILDEADLPLAVRYSGGRIFPATEERVVGASSAIVSEVLIRKLQIDPQLFYAQVVRAGEIGEALASIFTQASSSSGCSATSDAVTPGHPMTLRELADAFDELAATGVQQEKKRIIRRLFDRCAEPREAAYLAKIIFSDLRTGVREGVLQAAVAQAFDAPLAKIQRTQLLVGDLDEVALLARRNTLEAARFKLFHPIQFMLASPQESAEEAAATLAGKRFHAEDKLDGIRAQVHKDVDGRVEIYTRTMDRADESFPEVVDAIRQIDGEFVLDGEIVPWRNGCVLPFAHLQRRLGRKTLTRKMLRENPLALVAFDILYLNGRLLMDEPLRARRQSLERLLPAAPASQPLSDEAEASAPPHPPARDQEESTAQSHQPLSKLSPNLILAHRRRGAEILLTRVTEVTDAEQIDRNFRFARECRNEGLVLKDPDSVYAPGRRGKMWLKLKTHLPTLDCVVTAAEYGHGRRKGVLSDYTFAVWDRDPAEPAATLVNVGKAFSGVTDAQIAQLTEMFLKLSRKQVGHVHVVEPKVVLEIACDQIQRSDRHASGYALRFPRIKRIRWDKRAEDADRLARVAELYESNANFARREVVEPPAPEPTLFD